MRMMLTIQIPPEPGNKAIQDGSMKTAFENLHKKINPEAAYFTMSDGLRTAIYVYDLVEEYHILQIHEPLFAALGCHIEEKPVMIWADMEKAMEEGIS